MRDYAKARDALEYYTAVVGRLTLPAAAAAPGSIEGRIEGRALSAAGFDAPYSGAVTVSLGCVSVWCAAPPPDDLRLFFLRHDGDARVIEIGPCDAGGFPAADVVVDRVLACHLSNDCAVEE